LANPSIFFLKGGSSYSKCGFNVVLSITWANFAEENKAFVCAMKLARASLKEVKCLVDGLHLFLHGF
jgi:hypothetical protein